MVSPWRQVFNHANRVGTGYGGGFCPFSRSSRGHRQSWECGLAFVATRQSRFRHSPPIGRASRVLWIRPRFEKRFPRFAVCIPPAPSTNVNIVHVIFCLCRGKKYYFICLTGQRPFDKNGGFYG
jgi:hypothetical protein